MQRDQDICRLDIAVDDSFLVCVLHCLADVHKQLESLDQANVVFVAVARDRDAADQFHHEEWPTGCGLTSIQHLGDMRMVHERQSLSLSLKASNHLARVHPWFDDLDSHLALHRRRLFSEEYNAEAAFADYLEQFIRADNGARSLGEPAFFESLGNGARASDIEKFTGLIVRGEEFFHFDTKPGV